MTARADIPALTGLRGAAAALVVAFHFSGAAASGQGPMARALTHGYLAVDVFFILSGLVMALTYGAEFTQPWRPAAYRRFLLKRIGRVYPMYLAATLACVVLSACDPAYEGAPAARTVGANLLMVQSWGLSYSFDYPAWSISTEFAAYLLFPWLAAGVLGGSAARSRAAAALAAAALLAVAARHAGSLDAFEGTSPFPVLRCLAGFTLGLFAWRFAACAAVRQAAANRAVTTLLAAAIPLFLLMPGTDVAVVLLFTLLTMMLTEATSLPARLLSLKPLLWLGEVSYSLYLLHYPVMWALRPELDLLLHRFGAPGPGPATVAILMALSLGLAQLTFWCIERPCRALTRALARAPAHTPAGPQPTRPALRPAG